MVLPTNQLIDGTKGLKLLRGIFLYCYFYLNSDVSGWPISMIYVFNVSLISTTDCFFYVNDANIKKCMKNGELNSKCIKVEFGPNYKNTTYSSLSARPNNDIADDSIGINAVHAKLLGIKERDEVIVSIASAQEISTVYVRPQDESQYQLIADNQGLLENTILEQVRIVNVQEIIPISVFSNIVVHLKIEKLEPDGRYGALQKRTEVVILSPTETGVVFSSRRNDPRDRVTSNEINFDALISRILKFFQGDNEKSVMMNTSQRGSTSLEKKQKERQSKLCDRNNPLLLRIVPSVFAPNKIQKMIRKKHAVASRVPTAEGEFSPYRIYRIDKYEDCSNQRDSAYMQVYITSCSDQANDVLYVSDYCMRYLNVKAGSGVRVERQRSRDMQDDENITFYDSASVENNCFTEGVKKIYDNVVRTVVDNIRLNQKINTLITGSTGSGKTYLLNALSRKIKEMHLTYGRIDCKSHRRVKASSLEKTFWQELSDCCKTQPSVVIIDDLDALIVDDEEGSPYSAMYSSRIGDLIVDLITSYQAINEVTFIATGTSVRRLKDMSTDRGPIVFENIHEIGELETNERCYLLQRLSQREMRISKSVIEEVAKKTKAYNVQDLIDLVKIADFKRMSRNDSTADEITREDFEGALAEKIPLSLIGVNLQKVTLTKWEDIGGMEEAKKLLMEMFEWPLRYQELYKSCPLRLQCGVLLYGLPGTGKTLIAGAVANEFGLNFISIKGPEVFSKYVGASEQGVRDLFTRAKTAKPCLLFFDEFDSLARKRGSSNEDVNDRVVNQLLTELDGVEELTGVFILAATSRPDLLDPALLRPGRIDRTLLCKLPNQVERLSILKALSKSLKLSDDVKLEEVAEKTDGYSGADLQAVLYAAQMLLVKEISRRRGTGSHPELVLTQDHLLTALAETKPSISENDRRNYSFSYEAFTASRTGRSYQQPGYMQQKLMFA